MIKILIFSLDHGDYGSDGVNGVRTHTHEMVFICVTKLHLETEIYFPYYIIFRY
jgi:hypothetical protein